MLLKTNDINTYRENEDSCKNVSLILFTFSFRTATSISGNFLRLLGHVGVVTWSLQMKPSGHDNVLCSFVLEKREKSLQFIFAYF